MKETIAQSLIFKILKNSKITERLDTSHEFWKKYACHKPKLQKQAGLHEIESIDNANILAFPINPKEYYEEFKNRAYNKKHNRINTIFIWNGL